MLSFGNCIYCINCNIWLGPKASTLRLYRNRTVVRWIWLKQYDNCRCIWNFLITSWCRSLWMSFDQNMEIEKRRINKSKANLCFAWKCLFAFCFNRSYFTWLNENAKVSNMKRTFRNKNKMFHKNAFLIKRENEMVLILFPAIKL